MIKSLKVDCFGGKDGEAQNALMSALFLAAGSEGNVYNFLEKTPKTTLIVELYDSLQLLGYKIQRL